MRFLLVFLLLFTPLAWALWRIAGTLPDDVSLEAGAREGTEDAVLKTEDMPYLPVTGELIHLKNVNFQRFHPTENYVIYWVRAEGLERVDGTPRVMNITCAVFGEPVDGAENLRVRVVAPYLEGDPTALIGAATDDTQELVLGGGVKVYDPVGRLIAELDRIVINLGEERIWSDSDVHFRDPERRATLRGKGLKSDMKFSNASILSDVRLTLPLRKGEDELISIACKGAATMVRTDEFTTEITLNEGARIQHRDFYGTCTSVRAVIRQSNGGEYTVDSVTMNGNVAFDIDPKFARGLEEFHADQVSLIGEHMIVMSGGELPVRAVRRGVFEAFGLADRELDFEAPEIRLHFDRDAKDPLKKIEFLEGLNVSDRAGPGRFAAGKLIYNARKGTLTGTGGVSGSAPGRSFEAESAFASYSKKRGEQRITLTGEKTLRMRMAGRIGPLAQSADDVYQFSCDGPLVLVSTKTTRDLSASGAVHVRGRRHPILSCDTLSASMREESTQKLVALGNVIGRDAATGTKITADRLEFREDHDVPRTVVLNGSPAIVQAPDRELRGNHLEYSDGGGFEASGDVWADIVLPQGRWKFSCDHADGILPQDGGVPPYVHIVGDVRADGPAGAHLEADLVHFTKKTGRLTLKGSPARLRQNAGLTYEGASLGMDVVKDVAGYRVSGGETEGAAKIRVTPKGKPAVKNVAYWTIDLKGAADLKDDVLRVPKGADVRGFDSDGKRVIVMRGAAFEFKLKNQRPVAVRCSGGVDGETFQNGKRKMRLTADRFVYELDSNRIDLIGPGELWQGDAKESTHFSELEMEVVADGVKLKYLKKLETSLH